MTNDAIRALSGSSGPALAAAIERALAALADPARAVPMARYMRGRFPFLGIATPARRAATRSIIAAARREADEQAIRRAADLLWRLPQREYQYAGCDLLVATARSLSARSLPLLQRLVMTRSWWDTVDALASRVVGPLAARDANVRSAVDAWSVHSNPWLRRAAILHQLGYAARTDEARLFRHCADNLDDDDFFIRKAIGWALRQYAYVAPRSVERFLHESAGRMNPLTRREAGKHLPTAARPSTARERSLR